MLNAIASFPRRLYDRVTGRTERKLRTALQASYDAARSSRVLDNYWKNAEIQSANAAHSPAVQKTLRARSRYEFGNNGLVQRMVLQKSCDIIGTVPRLQLSTPSAQANAFIESQWLAWADAIHLGAKCRLLMTCRQVDGASLGIKAFNPKIPHAVKLDVRICDADRLHTPDLFTTSRTRSDGLRKDSYGNIVAFDLLRDHPNADYAIAPLVYDTVPAEFVMYCFAPRLAEQDRGIPETTPILNTGGQSRRYRQSVLTAAEMAAVIAGILKTNTGSVTEAADEDELGDMIELELGKLLTLPKGWGMEQMKAEQPTDTFADFNNELTKEQTAGMGMSLHKGSGDYSQTSYVSGKLADRDYLGNVDVERHDFGNQHLSPLFCDFAVEMALQGLMPETPALQSEQRLPYIPALQGAAGYMNILGRRNLSDWLKGGVEVPTLADLTLAPQELNAAGHHEAALILQSLPHEFFFDQPREIDPVKEAIARNHRLKSGTSSLRREVRIASGRPFEQVKRELAADLGVTEEEVEALICQSLFGSSAGAGTIPSTGSTEGNAQRSGVARSAVVEAIAGAAAR